MEKNEVDILGNDTTEKTDTGICLDIDTIYDYIKEQHFKFVDTKERKTIEFFKSKDEWICWCCGRIRIIIGDHISCISGIHIMEGTFFPNKERCQYLIDGTCQYQFICPNIRYGRKISGILHESK